MFYKEIIAFILVVLRNTQIKVSGKIQNIYLLNMAVRTVPLISNGLISIDGKTEDVHFHKAIAHLFFIWQSSFSDMAMLARSSHYQQTQEQLQSTEYKAMTV